MKKNKTREETLLYVGVMEESNEQKRWVSRRRRPIVACIIIMTIFLFTMTPLSFMILQAQYVTRSVSVTVSPLDEEMSINFDFYSSDSETGEGHGGFYGYSRSLDPSEVPLEFGFTMEIPWYIQNMWVEAYLEQSSGPQPSVIRGLSVGQTIYLSLQGIEISLIIRS